MNVSEPITLAQLASGALGERFDLAFMEALENALDPNRPVGKVRKVMITVAIAPKESKDQGAPRGAEMEIDVKTALVPLESTGLTIHFGRNAETGEPVALLVDPGQHEIFAADQPDEKIVPIGGHASGGDS